MNLIVIILHILLLFISVYVSVYLFQIPRVLRINIKQLKIAVFQFFLSNVLIYNFPSLHVVITPDINDVAYLFKIEAGTMMVRKPSDVYCTP